MHNSSKKNMINPLSLYLYRYLLPTHVQHRLPKMHALRTLPPAKTQEGVFAQFIPERLRIGGRAHAATTEGRVARLRHFAEHAIERLPAESPLRRSARVVGLLHYGPDIHKRPVQRLGRQDLHGRPRANDAEHRQQELPCAVQYLAPLLRSAGFQAKSL